MDIKSGSQYPFSALSNFAPHAFVLDGIECASMEGFLQSLKFEDPITQSEVCSLVGIEAKKRGQERNEAWKSQQTLWWRGQSYSRDGINYGLLLDKAYSALAHNMDFRAALLATGTEPLTHSVGCANERDTVLTENEFCRRLEDLRYRLQHF